jgi:hypothetical protein
MSTQPDFYTFVTPADTLPVCGICLGPPVDARRACNSDHYFCRDCLARMDDNNAKHGKTLHEAMCPICRSSLYRDANMNPGRDAPFMTTLVNMAIVRCCEDGCNEAVRWSEIKDHRAVCPAAVVKCPFGTVGCMHECKRRDMDKHLAEYSIYHTGLQNGAISNTLHMFTEIKGSTESLRESMWQHRCDDADGVGQLREQQFNFGLQLQRVCEKVDTITSALGVVVDTQLKLAPIVASRGELPACAIERIKRAGTEAKKRLMEHSQHNAYEAHPSSLRKKTRGPLRPYAPVAPNSSGRLSPLVPRAVVPPPPNLQYTPTSPQYSPISPQYDPM